MAPIVLFTYNRPMHTRATIEALKANVDADKSDLFLYSDGPKDAKAVEAVEQVRAYLRTVNGFRSVAVIERGKNMGLAASVIAGVTDILANHPAVIVVEDDLVTAPSFLSFMNQALSVYATRQDIFSVTGYNYPLGISQDCKRDAYLSYRSSSWGWGTWPDRWKKVDWKVSDFSDFLNNTEEHKRFARGGDDLLPMLKKQMAGELDSWSIRFDYAHYKHDAFCLHPVRSKLANIGFDGSGVHCGVSNEYDVEISLQDKLTFDLPSNLAPDPDILRAFDEKFRRSPGGDTAGSAAFLKRVLRRAAGGIWARLK